MCVEKKENHIKQRQTYMLVEVVDDDMIYGTQKKQQIKMLLLDDERWLDNKLNVSYQIETDLLTVEVADDDMI